MLVRDEFNQVNVSNLSTAQYLLLAEANGGEPVGSDEELLPLTQNLDIDQLLELAAVIKLVVDGGVALPAGTTDALALVSDPTALAAFIAGLDAAQLDTAIDEVAQDPALTPGYRPGSVPASYALIFPGAPGTIRLGMGGLGMLKFQGTAGSSGTGAHIDPSMDSDPALTWSLVDGDIVTTLANPLVFGPWIVPAAGCGSGYDMLESLLEVRLHRLQDGAGVDYVEASFRYYHDYTDRNPGDACVPPPDGEETESVRLLAFEDGGGELPFASAEDFGQIALEVIVPGLGRLGVAIFDFNTHTVSIPEMAPSFSSEVVNGRLLVHTIHAPSGTAIEYEYRRLQTDGGKGEGLMMLATVPDGQVADYRMSSRVDGSATFAGVDMPGWWRSGFDISQFSGESMPDTGFFLVLNPDPAQTGYQRSVDRERSSNQ